MLQNRTPLLTFVVENELCWTPSIFSVDCSNRLVSPPPLLPTYRLGHGNREQMVPSPSTGALTVATKAKTVYRGGDKADERQHHSGIAAGGRGIPAEKEQLRRNLSLLKKKMHSQAGSRRSQVRGGACLMFPCLSSPPRRVLQHGIEGKRAR